MKPSFDTWTTIFLFAAVQGLFVASVMLFQHRPVNKGRVYLAGIILLFSITLTEYVLYWTRYMYYFPHSMELSSGFPLLVGPLLYLYFSAVYSGKRWELRDIVHFIPFVLHTAKFAGFYLKSGAYKQSLMVQADPTTGSAPFMVLPWIRIAVMIGYLVIIYYRYAGLSRTTPDMKRWFKYLIFFFAGFIFSYASYFLLVMTPFFKLEWDYLISFSMSFFIYFLAWFGYQQPQIFEGFTVAESIRPKYSNSGLTDDQSERILQELDSLISKDKIYRDPEMTLEKLASLANAPKHHCSQVLNEKKGMSFFDFVNNARIEEAKQLLATTEKSDMNVIQVAFEVGFNNKVSFNTTFKKYTGLTPSQFRKVAKAG